MSEVKIQAGILGNNARVEVDGRDLSRYCRALSFTAAPRTLSTLKLELAVFEVTTISGQATLVMGEETRGILERAGWLPPQDEGEVQSEDPS